MQHAPNTDLRIALPNYCGRMAKQLFIIGLTHAGKTFRPSDWSERLCGVMSCFQPPGVEPQAHLRYSPYLKPITIGDTKCVVLDEALRDIEPLAYDFVISFARDNDLQTSDACLIPERK